jgi:Putative Zn-dependent protease, contains TPR repeats
MMFVASATAFAGDSDALKAILKAKTYAEADQLLKSSLDQLANDAEKAKAYNKLVDLAMDQFNAQSTIQTENQVAKQMGKEEKPVDEKLMAEMAYNAIIAAQECDIYDQKPNEKGKVAPKFGMKNAQRLWNGPRNALVNAGQEALSAQDNATARKYWQLFAESNEFPFFKACDREAQKPYFGQVARFAAIFAYQDKDMDKALQLADIAMKDPEEYENALNLKLEVLGNELKSKEDSVNYCGKLKDIYAEHKTDGVMEKLYNVLLGLGQTADADKILDDALAVNPNNFVALADKGLALLQAQKAAEAVNYLKKAYEVKSDNAVIATYAGTAYSVQAQETEDPAQKKALYKQAIELFDKAKELDPDRLQSNWGYNRYNAYYNYYGPDAAETQQAEADSK